MATRGSLSNLDQRVCADEELERQDARLNRNYKAALERLAEDPATKLALIKAQRAWVAYRDADCQAARESARGGTLASFLSIFCAAKHTERRADELASFGEP